MRGTIFCCVSLLGVALFAPRNVMAWDDNGHMIVAIIADHYLLPPAREKIRVMLSQDADTLTAHYIVSEATWADKYLESDKATTHERYDRTYAWHFANIQTTRPNIPEACFGQPPLPSGTPASQGPAKDCIVDKISQFAAELANPATSAKERLVALKFLLNLVGDIHEPLRVADENSGHGMLLQVSSAETTPGDLFTFWDRVLVDRLGMDYHDVANTLVARISDADALQWSSSAPQLWALEAHQIGLNQVYGMLGDYDNQGNSKLQDSDIDRGIQIVALQLSRAGVRLAHLLNEALVPASSQASAQKNVRTGDPAAGRRFALAACNVCHVVSPQQVIAPSSGLDVTSAPDFEAIAKTRGMSDVALREFLFGPHPTMPNMHLSQTQANNIIAYILSLQKSR